MDKFDLIMIAQDTELGARVDELMAAIEASPVFNLKLHMQLVAAINARASWIAAQAAAWGVVDDKFWD